MVELLRSRTVTVVSAPALPVDLPVDRRRIAASDGRRTSAPDGRRTAPVDRRRRAHGDRRRRAVAPGVRRGRPTEPDALDLEELLDELVRGLFALGLSIAGAVGQVEGPVADRLATVLADADRLVRTARSAAVSVQTERA